MHSCSSLVWVPSASQHTGLWLRADEVQAFQSKTKELTQKKTIKSDAWLRDSAPYPFYRGLYAVSSSLLVNKCPTQRTLIMMRGRK